MVGEGNKCTLIALTEGIEAVLHVDRDEAMTGVAHKSLGRVPRSTSVNIAKVRLVEVSLVRPLKDVPSAVKEDKDRQTGTALTEIKFCWYMYTATRSVKILMQ